jgi:hypothetical protein
MPFMVLGSSGAILVTPKLEEGKRCDAVNLAG